MKMKGKPMSSADRKTIEAWAQEKGTPDWLFAATKAVARWAEGREVSAKEYEEAVDRAAKAGGGDGNPFDVKPEPQKNEAKGPEAEGGSHQ